MIKKREWQTRMWHDQSNDSIDKRGNITVLSLQIVIYIEDIDADHMG